MDRASRGGCKPFVLSQRGFLKSSAAGILGLTLPELLAGDALVSIVLNLPTVGPLYLQALRAQDMYLACFFLMFYAALLIVGNFIADIALAWADPRIRLG